jgi:hypothetical protein
MAIFTVHAPEGGLGEAIGADRLVYVREGFSWGALVVPFLWAPWNGLWMVFSGWLAVTLVLQGVEWLAPTAGAVLSLAFGLWFAASARDLQRWSLDRRGHRLVGVVEARNRDDAAIRLLASVLARPETTATARIALATVLPAARTPREPLPVIGFAAPIRGRA